MDFKAVAHDLRAPLTVMLGHMRMLAVERLTDTGRHRLEVVQAQVHRMMRLLDSWSNDPRVASVAPVDLGALIGAVVSELEPVLDERGIRIISTGDGAIPPLAGDGDLLHRVLVNLLVNAADSMAGGGRIGIHARVEPPTEVSAGGVHIVITDTGSGIPAEVMRRVFDQGVTTKSAGRAHGLGLGICREILQLHGGEIQLSSEPGRGTTVRLQLPLER